MSYAALATDRFDEVAYFYGETLRFPLVATWDRPRGRGRRFDLGGMRLEVLDNQREPHPLGLGELADRLHLVIEVADINAAHARLPLPAPTPQTATWGARLFAVRDPDGVSVTFLEWTGAGGDRR